MYQQFCRRRSWWNCRRRLRHLHLGWIWSWGLIWDLEFHFGVCLRWSRIFFILFVQVDRNRSCLCHGLGWDGTSLWRWGSGWRGPCRLGLRLGINTRIEVCRRVRDGDRGQCKGRHLTFFCISIACVIRDNRLIQLLDCVCTGFWVWVGWCASYSVGLFQDCLLIFSDC